MRWSKALNNRVVQSVFVLVMANILGQLIQAASLPVLSRLFTPENFGVLAIFWSSLGVLSVVSSLRYEISIPLPKFQKNASLLLSLALYLNLIFSCLIMLVVFVYGPELAVVFSVESIVEYLWLLPVAIFLTGTYKALNYMLLRLKKYKKSGVVKVKQSAAQVLFTIVAGYMAADELGLILGLVFGGGVAVASLFSMPELKKLFVQVFTSRARLRLYALGKRYYKFPVYDVPGAGINVLSSRLPNFVIASFFGSASAGFYYIAERVFAIPMSLLGNAVSQVFYSQSIDDISRGVYRKKVIIILLSLSIIALPPVFILHFYAEPLFVFFFGQEWSMAGVYVSWLVIGLAVQFVYSPLSMVLMATGGQQVNLLLHVFMFIAKLLVLYLGWHFDSIEYALKGLSFVLVCGYGTGILLVLLRSSKADALSITEMG